MLKKVMLAAAFVVAGLSQAQAATEFKVGYNSYLKFEYPQGVNPQIFGCVAAGAEKMGIDFASRNPAKEIFADQFDVVQADASAIKFRARLSANINGVWVHRFYEMHEAMSHTCTPGSAVLLGESHD